MCCTELRSAVQCSASCFVVVQCIGLPTSAFVDALLHTQFASLVSESMSAPLQLFNLSEELAPSYWHDGNSFLASQWEPSAVRLAPPAR